MHIALGLRMPHGPCIIHVLTISLKLWVFFFRYLSTDQFINLIFVTYFAFFIKNYQDMSMDRLLFWNSITYTIATTLPNIWPLFVLRMNSLSFIQNTRATKSGLFSKVSHFSKFEVISTQRIACHSCKYIRFTKDWNNRHRVLIRLLHCSWAALIKV